MWQCISTGHLVSDTMRTAGFGAGMQTLTSLPLWPAVPVVDGPHDIAVASKLPHRGGTADLLVGGAG